jgi:hypothetical protein
MHIKQDACCNREGAITDLANRESDVLKTHHSKAFKETVA